jgi:hypothetical protein
LHDVLDRLHIWAGAGDGRSWKPWAQYAENGEKAKQRHKQTPIVLGAENSTMTRLLISTYNRVILWDGEQEHTVIGSHHQDHSLFFGITWNEDFIFVAESGNGQGSTYHILDKDLNRIGELPIGVGILYPHQIYWWDGRLYIASGSQDVIWIWNGETCYSVGWKNPDPEEPIQHLNSVWCDGKQFYVVEHLYDETPKRIRILSLGFEPVGCIEFGEEEFIRPTGLHNVCIENEMLYTCGSKSLVRRNLATGESQLTPIFVDERYRYVRGLARPPQGFFVGLSRLAARDERGEGDSAIVAIDNNFNVVDTIYLENTGGVMEIRAIDGPDLAHNQIECPCR